MCIHSHERYRNETSEEYAIGKRVSEQIRIYPNHQRCDRFDQTNESDAPDRTCERLMNLCVTKNGWFKFTDRRLSG